MGKVKIEEKAYTPQLGEGNSEPSLNVLTTETELDHTPIIPQFAPNKYTKPEEVKEADILYSDLTSKAPDGASTV